MSSFTCSAPGCTNAPARGGRHCSAHRNRLQRYGHPLQRSVSTRDLAPFTCRIASRLPEGGEVRSTLEGRWSSVLAEVSTVASGIVRDVVRGPSGDRRATAYERDAARRFLATARDTTSNAVADAVIGLAMLRALHPEAFEDDRAFRFIVSRRYLGLSPSNACRCRVTGSTTFRAYPPDIMLPIASWLLGAFGEVAERLAGLEVETLETAKADEARLRQTLACL